MADNYTPVQIIGIILVLATTLVAIIDTALAHFALHTRFRHAWAAKELMIGFALTATGWFMFNLIARVFVDLPQEARAIIANVGVAIQLLALISFGFALNGLRKLL